MEKEDQPKSHPAIEYRAVPVVRGKLFDLDARRLRIVTKVMRATQKEFENQDIESNLSEALYTEKRRIRRINQWSPSYLFNIKRHRRDQVLWKEVHQSLLQKSTEADRKEILHSILKVYADEIAGHFDPKVYHFATRFVPWLFSWVLNAASIRRFLPWGMSEALESRLLVTGEVSHIKKLADRGTILILPTHQSNVDNILIGYVIYLMQLPPFAYGAGLNLFTNPVLSYFMSNLGSYTVDRDKVNGIYKSTLKHYSAEILKEGIHSIFYPGGGRSRSGAVESKLKLGLMGTALDAQIQNLQEQKPNSRIFIVPMTTSYHFVLEAPSLIEQYLEDLGRHRFMGTSSEEPPQLIKIMRFFWKLFASEGNITVRMGKPLDVFGNFVDESGKSIGPNGTEIHPEKWLTTRGRLCADPQRDREYTEKLGRRVSDRFYAENTVLSTHLVAFAYFMALRRKFSDLDIFHILRLTREQRTLPRSVLLKVADEFWIKVRDLSNQGEIQLSANLKNGSLQTWVKDGIHHLGRLHEPTALRMDGESVTSDNLGVLYYYRNRLSGYGLSHFGQKGRAKILRGELDEKGFLV